MFHRVTIAAPCMKCMSTFPWLVKPVIFFKSEVEMTIFVNTQRFLHAFNDSAICRFAACDTIMHCMAGENSLFRGVLLLLKVFPMSSDLLSTSLKELLCSNLRYSTPPHTFQLNYLPNKATYFKICLFLLLSFIHVSILISNTIPHK